VNDHAAVEARLRNLGIDCPDGRLRPLRSLRSPQPQRPRKPIDWSKLRSLLDQGVDPRALEQFL
jgi:hypothetical protein